MDILKLSLAIGEVIPIVNAIGVMIGVLLMHRLTRSGSIFFYYLIACLLSNLSMTFFGDLLGNNLFMFPLFSLIELVFMTILFTHTFFETSIKLRRFAYSLAGIGMLYIIYELLSVDYFSSYSFQTYSRVLSAFIIVIFCFCHFFYELTGSDKIDTTKTMISSGLLIFYTMNVILLLPMNFLTSQGHPVVFYFWFVYYLFILLYYAFITYILWKSGKTR